MIIARGDDGQNQLLLLGLSHQNVRRLLAGEPIRITPKSHGRGVPQGWTIFICVGRTEAALHDVLKKAGVIGPMTQVFAMPRGSEDPPGDIGAVPPPPPGGDPGAAA